MNGLKKNIFSLSKSFASQRVQLGQINSYSLASIYNTRPLMYSKPKYLHLAKSGNHRNVLKACKTYFYTSLGTHEVFDVNKFNMIV